MRRWILASILVGGVAGAAPLPDDNVGRRAIRGAPVETERESEELRALRELDEANFPRPPFGHASDPDDGDPPSGSTINNGAPGDGPRRDPRRSATLTGGVGPDALPDELRSPDPARRAPDAASAIPWLSQLKLPDLPVRFDPRVVRYLELYKSDPRGRSIMSSWLRKQGRWRALFEDALRRAHLPLALIYVAMIESGYDPHDRSHAGAVGLWQFMPDNSHIYGLRVDYWIDERKNPERSTEAFTRYIGDLKERFGAWPLALAAFNAGYGAVLRSMQKYNTNDYWELCRHEDGLPWDTLLYVPKAMAAAIVGENRKLFGYDELPTEKAYAFDSVSVPTSMSVAAIAHAANVPAAEVELLNPELRRKRTPPEAWEARLPRGAGARFAANYSTHREMVKPFVVRFGERLDDLAREHGVSTHELRAMNGIDDSSEVRPGLTLVVPDGKSPLPAPPAETVIVAVPDKDAVVPGRRRVFYRTLAQDSIADIAAFFKVGAVELARWNHLDLDARLASSMVMQIWIAPELDATRAALVDPAIVRVVTTGSDEFFDLVEARRGRTRLVYTIKKGDDLKKIGKKFGLKVADLERINRFGAGHTTLTVGQKLTVYRNLTPAERAKAAAKISPGGVGPAIAAKKPDEPATKTDGAQKSEATHKSDDGAQKSGARKSDDGAPKKIAGPPAAHKSAEPPTVDPDLDDERPATARIADDAAPASAPRALPRPPPTDPEP